MVAVAAGITGCGAGCGAGAGDGGGVASRSWHTVFGGAGDEAAIHPRCRGYDLTTVPASYVAFEREVTAWIATCVTSRTDGAHRELVLVVGNPSLARLWPHLVPGRPARIRARYQWSADAGRGDVASGRVESIVFWSPDVPGSEPRLAADAPPDPSADSGRVSAPSPDGDRPPGARPGDIRVRIHDPPPSSRDRGGDVTDILDDAQVLLAWLRGRGASDDARRLAALIERARPYLVDIALLVGAYYVGSRVRAGALVFQWGWSASGPAFARAMARLDRLLPGAERAVGPLADEMVRIARAHPRLVGSDIDWKVLDQLVDPGVSAQLDANACGPACVQMVLGDRGIAVPQDRLIAIARAAAPGEIRTQKVTLGTLRGLLGRFDPRGGWVQATTGLVDSHVYAGPLFEIFGRRGAFIAQVDRHAVVVDGLDSTGHVLVRDPFPAAGPRTGFSGTRYRVPLPEFVVHWAAEQTVYRR